MRSQSINTLPRKRNGDAPSPPPPINGACGSGTPSEFVTIPVWAGNRPESITE